jgi:5-methylcytosine-specific restriction endonuclease McrA
MPERKNPATGTTKKRKRKGRPWCGWHVYLRDGWSRGLDEWRRRYDRYMLSPEWKKKREGVLERAGHVCAVCKQPSDRLQAHHVDYMRVGKERPEDLRAVCKPCHGTLHAYPGARQPYIPMDPQTRNLARAYREEAKALRQRAAAVAAGQWAPDDPDRPKIRRRPKPLVNPTDPTQSS